MYSAAFFLFLVWKWLEKYGFWFGNAQERLVFGLEMNKKYAIFGLEMHKKLLVFGLEMNKKYAIFGLEMKIKLYFINLQSCTSMEDEVLLRWSVSYIRSFSVCLPKNVRKRKVLGINS